MNDDKIVELAWINPPKVNCPYHRMVLREALVNKASEESEWYKKWHRVVGFLGNYRKSVYIAGGLMGAFLVMEGVSGLSSNWRESLVEPESVAIQQQIVGSIDRLESSDRDWLEQKTYLDMKQIREEVSQGRHFKLLGSQQMSPQLVWELAAPSKTGQTAVLSQSANMGKETWWQEVGLSTASGSVEMMVVSYQIQGETKTMGLTKGMIPLAVWGD